MYFTFCWRYIIVVPDCTSHECIDESGNLSQRLRYFIVFALKQLTLGAHAVPIIYDKVVLKNYLTRKLLVNKQQVH